MTKRAADYRSVAGSVHTQLVDVRNAHGAREPLDRYSKSRLETIKELLEVSRDSSVGPDGNLDLTRTTPEELTLARQLAELAPRALEKFEPDEEFNMREWSEKAVNILEALSSEAEEFSDDDVEFLKVELEGFLQNLLALPPDKPERFRV